MTRSDLIDMYRRVLTLIENSPEMSPMNQSTLLIFLRNLVKNLEEMETDKC